MRVVIAGGHGQVALQLARALTGAGHTVVGLVRNPDHFGDVEATGAQAALCDLEQADLAEVAGLLRGADATVFAAGAGPGSGAARKETVDRAAAVLLNDAAEQAGVARVVQVSSMGAGTATPAGTDDVFAAYLRAKAAAEEDLRQRPLDWTILRPGRLTNAPGAGRARLAPPPLPRGEVSRQDVAAVLAALLVDRRGVGHTLELIAGDVPISQAVSQL